MFSLSELLFPLQKYWCFSGQFRQYLALTLNSLYKSICDGHAGALGTCGDASVKEELAVWCLHPAGVVMCTTFPHCRLHKKINAHARKKWLLQIQTMFSVTLVLPLWSDQIQKHELQTASNPKMAWVDLIYWPPSTSLSLSAHSIKPITSP